MTVALHGAVRSLMRSWKAALLVALSIALAVSVNATFYSLLEALIYPKMDMQEPSRLYWANFFGDRMHRLAISRRDSILASHTRTFSLAYWGSSLKNETVVENGSRFFATTGARVSNDFFAVLGVQPVMGRVLGSEDTAANPSRVLLSQRVASELFPGASAIGKTIASMGQPRTVVGVLGDQADFPNARIGVWSFGDTRLLDPVIRIRPSYSRRDVEAELDTTAAAIARLTREPASDVAYRLKPAVETQFHYQRFHLAIAAACLAILLVACANAANLELGRTIARRRPLAVRAALGAGPLALVYEVFIEEFILAFVGTLLSLGATYLATRALYTVVPPSVGEFVIHPHVGWRVVTVATVVATFATLLIGSLPAIRAARSDPNDTLKESAGTGRTMQHRRQYAALVTLELGLAIALSCGAIVMFRANAAIDKQPLGFDPKSLVAGEIVYRDRLSIGDAMDSLARKVAAVPGITAAAAARRVPVLNKNVTVFDSLGNQIEIPAPGVWYRLVTAGYLRTLGLNLITGSDMDTMITDRAQVILDKKSAARLWPGRSPLGQHLKLGGVASDLPFAEVVGVIDRAPDSSQLQVLSPAPAAFTLGTIYYLPSPNELFSRAVLAQHKLEFTARSSVGATQVVDAIRRALITVNNASGSRVQPMEEAMGVTQARASRRFLTQLFAFLALCGLSLTGVAIFGIVARSVTERRLEISVRKALGARTQDVLRALLRETIAVGLLGLALGLILTKYAIPLLGSQALPDDRFNAGLFAVVSTGVLLLSSVCAVGAAMGGTRVRPSDAMRPA